MREKQTGIERQIEKQTDSKSVKRDNNRVRDFITNKNWFSFS